MKGVLPRATIGRPALRAALVSIEISTLTFFWKMSASNAFCAPAAPEPSSATSSANGRPSTPPLALISSTASPADCTTDGATTELAPERPTGTPILMGSAAVESVPVAGPPRFAERNIRGQNLLLVAACRTGHRPARMADDQALAFEGLTALGTDAVGAGDVDRIGMRGGHRENIGHRFAPLGLAGNRHPVGRHADDVGALERGKPIGLGKPAVVADRHADAADRGMKYRKAEVAGFEVQILFVPEMDLAECPDVTGRPDQHRAVEELIAVAFADASDQMQFVLRRDLAPGSHGRPIGDRLGQREGFLARLEHVSGVGKLRQHDQPRTELD